MRPSELAELAANLLSGVQRGLCVIPCSGPPHQKYPDPSIDQRAALRTAGGLLKNRSKTLVKNFTIWHVLSRFGQNARFPR
jgi:hypothetical protein